MGRRRERTGFGRRQVLQLNDSRRDDSPYRGQGGGGHWPSRNEANALSGLMAHYGESEESSEDEEMTPPQNQPAPSHEPQDMDIPEPEERPVSPKPATKENGHKLKRGNVSLDIDSKVANFLAEIDALDADSNDIDGEPLPETDHAPEADSVGPGDTEVTPPMPSIPSPPLPDTAQDHSDSADSRASSADEADDTPQPPTAPVTVWHHCQDENTQYFYYWNTSTNEVTWEIPLEYSQYLLQIKEYEEALARYEVLKNEHEEKQKNKPQKKKKRHKQSSAAQKTSNGQVAEEDPKDDEETSQPQVEKKPVKSWLLKKIRETYGTKYDTGDTIGENDPDTASTHPSEIGPQLPYSEIGPQLPPAEIEPQSTTEIGPQLPSQIEIGPQLLSQTEIGPQLPTPSEIGPQLPPLVRTEIGPQLPSEESYGEEAMIGPQLPPSLNFGSVPPPSELYSASDVSNEAGTYREAAADISPSRDGEFPDADSSGCGVAVADTAISGNGFPHELNNEADATEMYPDPFNVPPLPTVGLNDAPLVFKKPEQADPDMAEDEEFDLDFIDKQLEEPLESQYVKKRTTTTEEEVTYPSKIPKTDVKVKGIMKNKGNTDVGVDSEVKAEAKVNAEVKIKAEVETEVKDVAVEEEDSDMEFDIDDIDQELEAALEKTKAEEKKTIKKEVVPSPSKRKLSEDSSSSGEKPKKTKVADKEKSPQQKKKMDKSEIKIKAEVADVATLIMDKLEFLDIGRKGLSKLQMLLIEVETRINDWREGALNTQYLLGRLEDAEQQLQQYESSAAPTGWACHWDRTYKRYFYFHLTTGASQWDYPDDDGSTKDVTKSDAHSTATEPPSAPSDKVEPAQVSSSQVDGEREDGGPEASTPLPQCAQVDSTTVSTDTNAGIATVSSSVTSSINGKTEPPSSSVSESSSAAGPSSAFAVDPSLFQDLFAPAPPPPAEPPPPGVEAAPSNLTPPPPRPPPGLATSIPLSRSPPPPPPGTTPPPSNIEDVEMEITGMDATTSSLLAAAPPPPPPLDVVTSASSYQAPAGVDQAPQYPQMVGASMVMPPMVPPVIMAPPYISNSCTGMPMPVPMQVPQPPGSAATIVAPPVISGSGVVPAPAPPPPPHPPSVTTPPDTPPRNPVLYDPTLDGVPLVDSSHSSQPQSSTSSPSVSASAAAAAAAAQAKAEKKRKKEKKSAMGLSLKKKKLPSLVAKWEAVGRETSKHPKEDDSP